MLRSMPAGVEHIEIRGYEASPTPMEVSIGTTTIPVRLNTSAMAIAAMMKGLKEYYYDPLEIDMEMPEEIKKENEQQLEKLRILALKTKGIKVVEEKHPEIKKLILAP